MIALKRILVATDFSDTSENAVKYGVALARAFGARLHLLHVAGRQDLQVLVERQRVIDQFLREPGEPHARQNAARALLGEVLTPQDAEAVHAEYVLRAAGAGGPYLEIVRYASERDIDLIIVGTHGRGVIAHMLMGSVAERVVRTAPCPVLTVRHPEHEFVLP
jgi:nucleotide-binding universal stress UspA family protein